MTAATYYDVGDQVRLQATFRASDGVGTNPTAVTLKILAPDGTSTTPTPTSVGSGVYRYSLTLTAAGAWRYRWTGTGDVVASEEGTIQVRRRAVP